MRTRSYESKTPRLALALAALALAATSLGALVLLPVFADDRETAAAIAAGNANPRSAEARPHVRDARSATIEAHRGKRRT
jgi:hypothetical protein